MERQPNENSTMTVEFLETSRASPAKFRLSLPRRHLVKKGLRIADSAGRYIPARAPSLAHVLLCHGNAGNVGDRVTRLELLSAAGFDVLAFGYSGYRRSTGRPSEHGLHLDARAARDVARNTRGI